MPSVFHPAVAAWFGEAVSRRPPLPQARAWPPIRRRPQRPDRRADRFGQDARRVPRGDRRAGSRRARDRRCRTRRRVVYVSPLKALSNDIQKNLEVPLAGIRDELAARGLAGRRDPHARAHRRHAAARAREHAAASAAHRRHDARIAVRAARLGIGAHDARDDAHGDRRRDPRARVEQAGQPSRAVAGAPGGAGRAPARAHRPVGHAKADRGDRALPRGRATAIAHGRCDRSAKAFAGCSRIGAGARAVRDRRYRPRADRATSRSKCRRRRSRR